MRVLVVDDNPMDALLCQRLLERDAFQVTAASDPRLALEDLRQNSYGLLLVDVHMPHIGGFDLIARAKQLQPNIAVLLMTGYGTVETGILALQRDADGLILKPFQDVESLVSAARGALAQKRQKQDAARLQVLKPLFSITERIIAETNPLRLQELILESPRVLLGARHTIVFQSLPGENIYKRIASTGESGLWDDEHLVDSLVALAKDTPAIVTADAEELSAHRDALEAHNVNSFLSVPVAPKTGHYLFITGRESPAAPFDESELDLFVIFARQAVIELENAVLYEEQRETLKRLKESQRALVQAEKMAAVGQLLASVAHEVNNPIQAVGNCLHLADHPDLDEAQRQAYLRMGRNELDRLAEIVQRMLEFYRPGKPDHAPVNIQEVVETVLGLLNRQLSDHRVEVATAFAPSLPLVSGVQNQIQQVIFNLMLNAIDAMEPQEGPKRLWIEAEAAGDEVVLRVEDSGPGVRQGDDQHIFEPFYSTKTNGAGLGLAVSYSIIETHGGSIHLAPARHGSGACFQVNLLSGSRNGSI